jgi:hypothetical protein
MMSLDVQCTCFVCDPRKGEIENLLRNQAIGSTIGTYRFDEKGCQTDNPRSCFKISFSDKKFSYEYKGHIVFPIIVTQKRFLVKSKDKYMACKKKLYIDVHPKERVNVRPQDNTCFLGIIDQAGYEDDDEDKKDLQVDYWWGLRSKPGMVAVNEVRKIVMKNLYDILITNKPYKKFSAEIDEIYEEITQLKQPEVSSLIRQYACGV